MNSSLGVFRTKHDTTSVTPGAGLDLVATPEPKLCSRHGGAVAQRSTGPGFSMGLGSPWYE